MQQFIHAPRSDTSKPVTRKLFFIFSICIFSQQFINAFLNSGPVCPYHLLVDGLVQYSK